MIIQNLTHGEIQLSEPGYHKSKVGCVQRGLTKCSNVRIREKMQKSIELTLRILSDSDLDFQIGRSLIQSDSLDMQLVPFLTNHGASRHQSPILKFGNCNDKQSSAYRYEFYIFGFDDVITDDVTYKKSLVLMKL